MWRFHPLFFLIQSFLAKNFTIFCHFLAKLFFLEQSNGKKQKIKKTLVGCDWHLQVLNTIVR